MKFWLLLLLSLPAAYAGTAQTILSRADFISGSGDAARWGFNRAGDQKAMLL